MSHPTDIYDNKPDSARIVARSDGSWDLCLPSGKHLRGRAASQEAALAAANQEYERYVLGQWKLGNPIRGQSWCCPLK